MVNIYLHWQENAQLVNCSILFSSDGIQVVFSSAVAHVTTLQAAVVQVSGRAAYPNSTSDRSEP